ncbi:MAG: error-prone DNA polymerase [Alphaproteobacteria bacterium]
MSYVELQVTSNFSFLRGGSHAEELVQQAAAYGYKAIGIADRNTLSGIVRAHVAAKENGLRLVLGCRLDLQDGPSLIAYPQDRAAYARLCQLLTRGNLRAEKGQCHLFKKDVFEFCEGMKLIAVPPEKPDAAFETALKEYRAAFGRELSLAATHYYRGDDAKRLALLAEISSTYRVPLAATNDVHYHHPNRRELQDVLTCIREKCTIFNAGYRLSANAERHLKPAEEMARLFDGYAPALERSAEIAASCRFSLEELRYEYPDEIMTAGRTAQEELVHLTLEGAHRHYGENIPEKVIKALEHEFDFIAKKNYAPYFLTVYDAVRFARSKDILCQGRGSAANSAVCFCLGITAVDPMETDLLFERFVSDARNEPPDIDVDFEHERREEVMQYIYKKYGRDRAGIVATVCQYRQKGAIRDVGKAMGLSVDTLNMLSKSIWRFTEWFEKGNLQAPALGDAHLMKTVELAGQLMGFPRHLSQHVGGFVITKGKLSDLCPIMNGAMEDRTHIEWNKDDIDAMGFMKVDCLALGMLTCIKKGFELAKAHYGLDLTLANIPKDDEPTYNMICKADTIGVFQIESRAQMSMLPRLKPRSYYDLVIEVAIVRPGPIQGDMVHPYLRRRDGLEKVEYPKEELRPILQKTLGVPLFQEQAMQLAIVAAKFSPTDADKLRRSMATFKAVGTVNQFHEKLVGGMVANGYPRDFAERCYKQLEGFGSYGFPESHAASFAKLVYVSAWMKCHYPDVFACALLNSLPMGFYEPAQIIIDARKHSVEVRPVDVNLSDWDYKLEEQAGKYRALRLGFRQIGGLGNDEMKRLCQLRAGGYEDISALLRRGGIPLSALETLAQADAFNSIGLDRRQALWEVKALSASSAELLSPQVKEAIFEPDVALPKMTEAEHVVHDYAATSLTLKTHPVAFLRGKLSAKKITPAQDLTRLADGSPVKVAGLVLVRQRPGTASGVLFITLEDETGVCNLVVWNSVFEEYRREILASKLLMAEGKLQREGDVIHIVARKFHDLSAGLRALANPEQLTLPLLSQPSEKVDFSKARNFR